MKIIAPCDGQVLYLRNRQGRWCLRSERWICQLGHLFCTQVDESNIASVNVGDPVTATLDAIEGLSLTGKIVAVDPVGQENSGVVKYTAIIDLDMVEGDVFLPLQATVNVAIQAEPPTTVLAVPTGLYERQSG